MSISQKTRFKMSNIYIPIDFSNVITALPPKDEIIYSIEAKVKYGGPWIVHESDARKAARRGDKQYKVKWWNTHLLITSKGLAFEVHYKYGDGIEAQYFPLYLYKDKSHSYKNFYVTIPNKYLLSNHEVSLIGRVKGFKRFLIPFIITEHTEMLKELSNHVEKNPDYSYSEYLTTHKYPFAEFHFRTMKNHFKKGGTVEEYYTLKDLIS